jgi:hypothetical protein
VPARHPQACRDGRRASEPRFGVSARDRGGRPEGQLDPAPGEAVSQRHAVRCRPRAGVFRDIRAKHGANKGYSRSVNAAAASRPRTGPGTRTRQAGGDVRRLDHRCQPGDRPGGNPVVPLACSRDGPGLRFRYSARTTGLLPTGRAGRGATGSPQQGLPGGHLPARTSVLASAAHQPAMPSPCASGRPSMHLARLDTGTRRRLDPRCASRWSAQTCSCTATTQVKNHGTVSRHPQ